VKQGKQHANRHKYRKLTDELARLITQLVCQYLSPEQVSGYLKQPHALNLSHETIYRFIYSDGTRKAELKPFLCQGCRHRCKRYGSGARTSCIPNRISVTERPHEGEKKERLGDWKRDTVIGKDRKSILVTVVDCASFPNPASIQELIGRILAVLDSRDVRFGLNLYMKIEYVI